MNLFIKLIIIIIIIIIIMIMIIIIVIIIIMIIIICNKYTDFNIRTTVIKFPTFLPRYIYFGKYSNNILILLNDQYLISFLE